MAYLGNSAVNRANLHSTIQAVARSGGAVFLFVFLLQAGLSISAALLSMAGINAGRFILRPLIFPLETRFGLKPLVMIGALLQALQYPLLANVHGVGGELAVFLLVASVADIFYWPTYNAYFASIGDAEHRGHQVGAREAAIAVVGIVAPVLGAWALVHLGSRAMFAGVGVIQAVSVLPLVGAPNVAVKANVEGAFRAARLGALLSATDGFFDGSYMIVWQIALFVSLGHNIGSYGGAMALVALIGAVLTLVLGRQIDAGHGRRAVLVSGGVTLAVILLRAASFGTPWLAVIANGASAFVNALFIPTMSAAIYNISKASPCPARFSLMTEAGWDIGCSLSCVLVAALVAAGASLVVGILLGIVALVAETGLLLRIYQGPAMADPNPTQSGARNR